MSFGIKYKDFEEVSLNHFYELTKKIGWIWYFKGICFISDRPVEIHKKEELLHNEKGPALSFRDDYSIWCLNGINVPKELVETPSEKLSIEMFKKEKNADVKAEFIRKYGIDRMASMGKVVDKWENYSGKQKEVIQKSMGGWVDKSEYEVIDMSPVFPDYEYLAYLKMKNQTTGVYHLECVGTEAKTIIEAVNERLGFNILEHKLESID